MSSGPIEVRHGGARYALLARRDVYTSLDEEAARRLVEDGLREHGDRFAWQLEELARQLGSQLDGGHGDPVAVVVDALVTGRLVAVCWDAPVRLMSEPEHTALSDLGGGDLAGPLVAGAPREPTPTLSTTWVSFDVVDDRGEPVEIGRFGAAIDGRGEGGPLDATRHHYDMVRDGARATLRLDGIVWPFEPEVASEPTERDDPAPPSHATRPDAARVVSLEVVDDQGVAIVGRYALTDAADEVQGELPGVVRREVTGDAPRLRLYDLVFPAASDPSSPTN